MSKDIEEFIAEHALDREGRRHRGGDYLSVDELRDWMAGHVRVPVETIRRAIYAIEHFAYDTVAGRNSAHELHELLSAAKEEDK